MLWAMQGEFYQKMIVGVPISKSYMADPFVHSVWFDAMGN